VVRQSAEAVALFEGLRSPLSLTDAQIVLARALAHVGERDEAARLLELALAESGRIGAVALEAVARDAIAAL
jgi:hypothetical protein